MDVTSNGLSNAMTVFHPSHTLFRFRGKKLKSAHLLDFLCKEFLPFLLKVFRSMEGLGDDSARNWPFTFTFAPVPPRLLCWGILLYALMYMMSRRYASFYISLAYPQATVRPWDKNSSLWVIVSWDPQTFVLILTEWIFLCLHEKWRGVRSKKKSPGTKQKKAGRERDNKKYKLQCFSQCSHVFSLPLSLVVTGHLDHWCAVFI